MARHRFRVRSCSISKCEPAQLTAFDSFARSSSFARIGDSSSATSKRASSNSRISAWEALERVMNSTARSNVELWEGDPIRSEEHTSELQSLMRISYAVFCLNNKIYKHVEHKDYKSVILTQLLRPTII